MAGNHSLIALETMQANGAKAPRGIIVQGNEWQIPCVDVSHLSALEAQAYAIADNRTQELGQTDEQRLSELLTEIRDTPEGLIAVGYSEDDLAELLKKLRTQEQSEQQDPGPEDPEANDFGEVRVEEGQVWALGDHVLLCGDSTNVEHVKLVMGGEKAMLMATDPPYVVNYKGGSHPGAKEKKRTTRDKDWSEDYFDAEISEAVPFFKAFLATAVAEAIEPCAAVYIWHASLRQPELSVALRSLGFLIHQQIIWVKTRAVLTYSHYQWQHEPCLYGWLEGNKPKLVPPPEATTVWAIGSVIEDGVSGVHPTQKPLETIERPIQYHTIPGDLLFEPFGGSGTALIAAERTGRRCRLIEKAPKFCEVILRRWEQMTGKHAELISHG